MARNSPDPADPPRRISPLFLICGLVLVEVLIWTALSAVTEKEAIRTVVTLAVAAGLVFAFRDRLWGADWRARVAADRERAEQRRR